MLGWLEQARTYIRQRYRREAKFWIWGQVIFIWGLAQALPDRVLDDLPLIASACHGLISAIPSASSYVARSAFPQVAELVLGIGWLLAPANFCFGLLLPEHMHKSQPKTVYGDLMDIKPSSRGFNGFFVAGLIWLILVPAIGWAYFTIPLFDPKYGNDGVEVLFSYDHRITFGLVAQIISSLFGICLATWAVVLAHFIGFFCSFFKSTPL